MPGAIDPAIREALIARLRFYRDLGVTEFYRRPVDAELLAQSTQVSESRPRAPEFVDASPQTDIEENETIPPRKPIPAPPAITTEIKPADKAAALRLIREDIGDCTRCALHKGRNKIVFADGSPNAGSCLSVKVRAPMKTRKGCHSSAAPDNCSTT